MTILLSVYHLIYFYTQLRKIVIILSPELSNSGVDGIMKKVNYKIYEKEENQYYLKKTSNKKIIRNFMELLFVILYQVFNLLKRYISIHISHSKNLELIFDRFIYE